MSNQSFLFHLNLAGDNPGSQSLEPSNPDFVAELETLLPSLFVSRNSRQYGSFDTEADLQWLGALEQGHGEANYQLMAERLLNQWLIISKDKGLEDQGQLFIHVAKMDTDAWLYITWSRYQSYWVFDANGQIKRQQVVQPEQIDMGFKCHINDWLNNANERYLSLLSGKASTSLKKAFIELLGFKAAASTAGETANFLTAVEKFAQQQEPEQQAETREKVISYCQQQEKYGENVEVKEVAELISERDPQQFQKIATEHDIKPEHSWLPDRGQLRQFARFSGRDDNLSISFSSNVFGQTVQYDAGADALIIKNPPKRLRSQMQKHLSSQQDD